MYLKPSVSLLLIATLFSGCNSDENNYYQTAGSDRNITVNVQVGVTTNGEENNLSSSNNGVKNHDNITIRVEESNGTTILNRDSNQSEGNSSTRLISNPSIVTSNHRDDNSSTQLLENNSSTTAIVTREENNNSTQFIENNSSIERNEPIDNNNSINDNTTSLPTNIEHNSSTISYENNISTIESNRTTTLDEPVVLPIDQNITEGNASSMVVDSNLSTSTEELPSGIDAGEDKTVSLNTPITVEGKGVIKYEWKEADEILATTAKFDYNSKSVGEHTLIFTITDMDGLVYSDTVTIMVNESNETNSK